LIAAAGPAYAEINHIADHGEALAYIDRVFAEEGCAMRLDAFRARMLEDGIGPKPSDMSQPIIGTEKIIRERRVLRAIEVLFADGFLSEDAGDKTRSTSHFGACS
jgi:hypothetical protein